MSVRHFFTKVVGVTKQNIDGTHRQFVISRCEPYEKLVLQRDPDNPIDPIAIRITRQNGEQLGTLKAQLAKDVVTGRKRGFRFSAFVQEIAADDDGGSLGVKMLIVAASPQTGKKELQEYLRGLGVGDAPAHGLPRNIMLVAGAAGLVLLLLVLLFTQCV